MNTKHQFFAKFKFDQSKVGFVGVEREQFLADPTSRQIVPLTSQYLERVASLNGWASSERFNLGYELSACQLESRIGPCRQDEIVSWLNHCERTLNWVDKHVGVKRLHTELAPLDMPLDIYPDPTGRYQQITKDMPIEILRAACRVAATHIHIGMPDMETAIKAYNQARLHTQRLIALGDHTSGERMKLYPIMAPRYMPEPITSFDDFYEQAVQFGFTEDVRKCWTLVRISTHGTIEFRMFGATGSVDQIESWVKECHALCF
jgi:glutamate---cysteine ligase / carboxylate-amine ligase